MEALKILSRGHGFGKKELGPEEFTKERTFQAKGQEIFKGTAVVSSGC